MLNSNHSPIQDDTFPTRTLEYGTFERWALQLCHLYPYMLHFQHKMVSWKKWGVNYLVHQGNVTFANSVYNERGGGGKSTRKTKNDLSTSITKSKVRWNDSMRHIKCINSLTACYFFCKQSSFRAFNVIYKCIHRHLYRNVQVQFYVKFMLRLMHWKCPLR